MLTPGSDLRPDELRGQLERLVAAAGLPGAVERLTAGDRAMLQHRIRAANRHLSVPMIDTIFPATGPFRRELYAKHLEHFRAGRKYKARAFMAANRVGKSWAGSYELTRHATGIYPDWWEGWRIDHPGEYMCAAKTTKTLKKVPQRAMFGKSRRDDHGRFRIVGNMMVPEDRIMHEEAIFMPAAPGTLSEIGIRFRDSRSEYSTLDMFSYEMGRGVFEGTSYDFAWLDEECPEDIFAEVTKRLMTTQGRMVLTWTPLDGLTAVVLQFLGADYKPPEDQKFDVHALLPERAA